jgi:hypothetical protein
VGSTPGSSPGSVLRSSSNDYDGFDLRAPDTFTADKDSYLKLGVGFDRLAR